MKKARRVRPDNYAALEYFGQALLHFAKTGQADKLRIAAISVKNIAECLIAVSRGEDAREVFRQTRDGKPGRQRKGSIHYTWAVVYWKARAENPPDVDGAVRKAQHHFSESWGLGVPSKATILRNARRYRDHVLDALPEPNLNTDVSALRAYLAKKGKRGRS